MKKKTTFQTVFSDHILPYILLAAGAVTAAFALEEFLVPFTILDGGVVGVSMIVNQLTDFSLSLLIILFNIPFVVIGVQQLGKTFLARAVFSMVLFSAFLEVFHDMPAVTDQSLLVVVFGGVLLGVGVGLILRNGGCLDGTEIVGLLLSKKGEFSVGQIVFGINIIIFGTAGILFGLDRALYSLLTYFITSKIIDMVEEGMEQGKSVMIITDDGKEIAELIHERLGRTCTLLEGTGLISGKKVVLYCVITRVEVPAIKRIIHETDASAFVAISDVAEIVGQHIKKMKDTHAPME